MAAIMMMAAADPSDSGNNQLENIPRHKRTLLSTNPKPTKPDCPPGESWAHHRCRELIKFKKNVS